MAATYRIEVKHGYLCVVCRDTHWTEPQTIENYWPSCRYREHEHGDLIGREALPNKSRDGWYSVKVGGEGFNGYWRDVVLRDGGDTKPIRTDYQELPAPKCRCEVRYHQGQWLKKLKGQGWVPA